MSCDRRCFEDEDAKDEYDCAACPGRDCKAPVEGIEAVQAFGDALCSLRTDCPETFQALVDDGLITLNKPERTSEYNLMFDEIEEHCLPLGKQIHPVMVGRHKSGDSIIQTRGLFVQIPVEHAPDLPAAIIMAIAQK